MKTVHNTKADAFDDAFEDLLEEVMARLRGTKDPEYRLFLLGKLAGKNALEKVLVRHNLLAQFKAYELQRKQRMYAEAFGKPRPDLAARMRAEYEKVFGGAASSPPPRPNPEDFAF